MQEDVQEEVQEGVHRSARGALAGVAGCRRVAAAVGTAAVQELGGCGDLQGRLR